MSMPPKPEFEPEKNDRRKKSIVIKVNNMKEFFELDFGKSIQKKVAPTNYRYQGQAIYRVTEKIPNSTLKKGDYFYLDALHRDHFEVFNKNGVIKNVLNLDGTINEVKAKIANDLGRNIKSYIR